MGLSWPQPDNSTKSFEYYDDGELKTITRADGTVLTFDYDDVGRMKEVKVNDVHDTGYTYDHAGHLLTADNPHASLAFTWDSAGNQLSESQHLLDSGFADLGAKGLTRTYDMANRPETLVYPDALGTLHRGYDAGDRLVSLTMDSDTLWPTVVDGAAPLTIVSGAEGVTLGWLQL